MQPLNHFKISGSSYNEKLRNLNHLLPNKYPNQQYGQQQQAANIPQQNEINHKNILNNVS